MVLRQDSFELQLQRLHDACGTSNMAELGKALHVGLPAITDAKRRKKIPDGWLLFILRNYALNPEWIISGCGDRFLKGAGAQGPDCYMNGHAVREKMERMEALQKFSARELAEELLRRIKQI